MANSSGPSGQAGIQDNHNKHCGSELVGSCTSKAIFMAAALKEMGPHFPWKTLWKLKIPSKLKFFAWLILNNALATRETIHWWDSNISALCMLCSSHTETVDHLFAYCSITTVIWNLFPTFVSRPTTRIGFA